MSQPTFPALIAGENSWKSQANRENSRVFLGTAWGQAECQLSRRFQFQTLVLSLPPQPRRKWEEVGVKVAQISPASEGGFLRSGKSSFPTTRVKWESKGPSQTSLLTPTFACTTLLFLQEHLCTQTVKPRAPQNPALPVARGPSSHVSFPLPRRETQSDLLTRCTGLGAAISPTQTCTGKKSSFLT